MACVSVPCAPAALKPLEINHEEAAACLLGGIWSYMALHYHFKLSPGETMLILNGNRPCADAALWYDHSLLCAPPGGSPNGHIAVQLAAAWGAKVIVTASSVEELNYLNDLRVT